MESSPKRRRIELSSNPLPAKMTAPESTYRTSVQSTAQQPHADAARVDPHKLKLLSEMSQYKSNTFKLELDEMLLQVQLSQTKNFVAAEKMLHRLRAVIEAIPGHEGLAVGI